MLREPFFVVRSQPPWILRPVPLMELSAQALLHLLPKPPPRCIVAHALCRRPRLTLPCLATRAAGRAPASRSSSTPSRQGGLSDPRIMLVGFPSGVEHGPARPRPACGLQQPGQLGRLVRLLARRDQ